MSTMQGMQYPVFEQNQTLSHTDLNSLFDYLNNQDILMRANLVGIGIVSGLNVSHIQETNKIKISKGCGVTSDGHLIFIEKDYEFGYDRKITENELVCSSFLKNKPVELIKLRIIEAGSGEIDKDIYTNNTVIICYELRKEKIFCCSKEDDGSKKKASIFILLVPNNNLAESSSSTPSSPTASLPVVAKLPRLVDQLISISAAIEKAYSLWGNKLGNSINSSIDKLNDVKSNANPTQIHYDFINDLTEAYEEFRQCGEKVLLKDRLSMERFSCHLILNGDYRHNFYPATAKNDYIELRWLWERLVTMIEYFNPNTVAPEIRLTPSVYGAVSLSEKAVPYYYKKTDIAATSENQKALDDLHKAWTIRKNKVGYWYDWYGKSDTNYLNYDLEKYNFVRIEGHINGDIKSSLDKITNIASPCKLPVSVISIPLNGGSFISPKEKIFGALLSLAKKNFNDILFWNAQDGNNPPSALKERAETAKNDAAGAKTAAQKAEAAAQKAEAAAKATPPIIETVKEAATAAATAAAAAAANNTLILIAKTAAEETETAAQEAKTAAAQLNPNLSTVVDRAAVAAAAAKKAAVAAAAAETTAAAIVEIEKVSNSLQMYVDSFISSVKKNYETVISFACDTDKECIKLIAFTDWINETCQEYKTKNEFSSFVEFKKKHPGLQHKSGAPIGGTFILVYNENNTVIDDFCLPYRVTQPD